MNHASTLLAAVTEASPGQGGPGWVLRSVIIFGVLGAVLVAWFLLRGYRDQD
ncbi:hypothetical protein ACFV3R_03110 [Streptomyces sp. NPDC059740]|uniref:hypothetical protein n=1 Tax=Streptomyces sp. NPDC059740 TaxID=3346926 RepID=UPI00364A9A44